MTIHVKVIIDGASVDKNIYAWDQETLQTCHPSETGGPVLYKYYRKVLDRRYGEGWEHWSAGPFDDLHEDDQYLLEL